MMNLLKGWNKWLVMASLLMFLRYYNISMIILLHYLALYCSNLQLYSCKIRLTSIMEGKRSDKCWKRGVTRDRNEGCKHLETFSPQVLSSEVRMTYKLVKYVCFQFFLPKSLTLLGEKNILFSNIIRPLFFITLVFYLVIGRREKFWPQTPPILAPSLKFSRWKI